MISNTKDGVSVSSALRYAIGNVMPRSKDFDADGFASQCLRIDMPPQRRMVFKAVKMIDMPGIRPAKKSNASRILSLA